MTKAQATTKNKIEVVRWEKPAALTQEEAEARLHQEGYSSFCWYDVPGTQYPRHRHQYNECIWMLRGEIHFTVDEETFILKSGDKIYLPAKTPHTVEVPDINGGGATFLVGQKKPSRSE